MAISRKTIEDLAFTTKKGKYYVGEEVDAALDTIADEVDALLGELQNCRNRLEGYEAQEKNAQSFEERLQEQFRKSFEQIQNQLEEKKRELENLTEEIGRLQDEKRELSAGVASALRDSIQLQNDLLERWEDRPKPQEEAAGDVPDETDSCVPEEPELPPIPFPDAQEVLESDVWNS